MRQKAVFIQLRNVFKYNSETLFYCKKNVYIIKANTLWINFFLTAFYIYIVKISVLIRPTLVRQNAKTCQPSNVIEMAGQLRNVVKLIEKKCCWVKYEQHGKTFNVLKIDLVLLNDGAGRWPSLSSTVQFNMFSMHIAELWVDTDSEYVSRVIVLVMKLQVKLNKYFTYPKILRLEIFFSPPWYQCIKWIAWYYTTL